MNDDLLSLYAFNRWADDRVYEACRKLSESDYKRVIVPGWSTLHATIYHIAGAMHLWARRFEGETVTSFPSESEVTSLDDARRILDDAQSRIEGLLAAAKPEDLNAIRTFTNLKGTTNSLPYWAALRHVVNHATYHRGQVGSKLRLLGVDPPVTDLYAWAVELTARRNAPGTPS